MKKFVLIILMFITMLSFGSEIKRTYLIEDIDRIINIHNNDSTKFGLTKMDIDLLIMSKNELIKNGGDITSSLLDEKVGYNFYTITELEQMVKDDYIIYDHIQRSLWLYTYLSNENSFSDLMAVSRQILVNNVTITHQINILKDGYSLSHNELDKSINVHRKMTSYKGDIYDYTSTLKFWFVVKMIFYFICLLLIIYLISFFVKNTGNKK